MGRVDRVYAKMPVLAQHAFVSAYGLYWYWLRFGPGYTRFLKEYTSRELFSQAEWNVWQREKLRVLLQVAADKIPYYHNTWTKEEKKAALAGKLEGLPLLEKSSVRMSPEAFLRQDIKPSKRIIFHTSGSTGTPIATYWTVNEVRESLAVREVRSARWAGVSFKMPRATFSGRIIEPDPNSAGPFYRYNLIEHQVYFSAFHLRPETAHLYVEALRRHQIRWMTGYAVSYYLLAKFILEQKLKVPNTLQSLITTSEKVTPEMREVMKKAYNCRVYEEYSTVENALFVSECEHGRLHVSPDVGVVEILRPDGTPCTPGEEGEVVTTCLTRQYQPFIRYKLGDIAMWDTEQCPCGRAIPVLKKVIGRIEDVVIGPDGRQMVRFHGIFIDQPHVQEGQIIQEALDRIRVKVVPATGFSSSDIQDIIKRVKQRLGPTVHVSVQTVDSIPRTTAGKFRAVVSLLND